MEKLTSFKSSFEDAQVFIRTGGGRENRLSEDHRRQGFAWRPEWVTILLIEKRVTASIVVLISSEYPELLSTCAQAIQIPINIAEGDAITLTSLLGGDVWFYPTGTSFNLIFEQRIENDELLVRVILVPTDTPEAKILKAGPTLQNPPSPLVMTAEPMGRSKSSPKHPHPKGAKPFHHFKHGLPYLILPIYTLPKGDGANTFEQLHLDQGFAYRPGSVTFFLTQDCLEMEMNVYLMDKMPPVDKKAEQVIETPFEILPGDELFIDNFSGTDPDMAEHLPAGTYTLRFEQGKDGEDEGSGMAYLWGRLIWVPTENPVAKILKAGPELVLTMPTELCMTSGAN
jgi:hypothetical protein